MLGSRIEACLASVLLVLAACSGDGKVAASGASTSTTGLRFEVRDRLAPACDRFWEAPTYPKGTDCGKAREALSALFDGPATGAARALQSLDGLCADGIVEACDAGRELMWRCESPEGATPTAGCDALRDAGRLMSNAASPAEWEPGELPAKLTGCFVVEDVRTCVPVGNAMLEPGLTAPCTLSLEGCPAVSASTARTVDMNDAPAATSCDPAPHVTADVGTKHCFDAVRWTFVRTDGSRGSVDVRWNVLAAFEGTAAETNRGVAMTLEGEGTRPVMRIARTKAWLRRQ